MSGTSYVALPIGKGTIAAARKACRTEAAKRLQVNPSKIEPVSEAQIEGKGGPELAITWRTKTVEARGKHGKT